MITVKMLRPDAGPHHVGLIPYMLDTHSELSAVEQLNAGYAHGGGWRPFKGFKMLEGNRIKYPGDPALEPIAEITLRNERILIYDHAWVAVVQPDGTFEICRMD